MVPAFNLPEISMKTAYGISLVFSMLKGYNSTKSDCYESPWVKLTSTFIGSLVVYTFILIVGSIVAGL